MQAKPPFNERVVADCVLMLRSRNAGRETGRRRLLPSAQAHCTSWATACQLLCQKQPSSYKHSQPQLLLISNTVISGNQVSRDLPKSGALKLHPQFPSCAHKCPSATLAALGLTQRSPVDRKFFLPALLKAVQLPGCDSLLWEGPNSLPGNTVIREYLFQN